MKIFLIVFLFILVAGYAQAYDGITYYGTEISSKDRVSSKGVRLTTLRQILRQDRANYYKFNKRDSNDQSDGFFTSAKNRQIFDTAKITITPENISKSLKQKILGSGSVLITVFILDNNLIDIQEGLPPPNAS